MTSASSEASRDSIDHRTPSGQKRVRRSWESAHIVIAISIVLVVGVFGTLGYLVWQGYHSAIAQGEARAQRGADLVARQAGWVIGSSLGELTLFEELVKSNPDQPLPELIARTKGALQDLPAEAKLSMFSADGNRIETSGSPWLPETVADQEFFQAIAAGADWWVSTQMQDASNGDAIFVIARRIQVDGTFAGVAALVYRSSLIKRIWEPLALGEDSSASLVREDGWVVARWPELPERFDARNTVGFLAASSGADRGIITASTSPADGISRIVAFSRLPEYGIISYGAVSERSVLNDLWARTYTALLLLGPIGVALMLGSVLTAWLLHQSARNHERLSAALAHNDVLFREIHHRVKNNLQSVASLLQLQPIPQEVKQEMSLRISAMSAVHEHVYRSSNFTTVTVRDYLQTLIRNIEAGQHGDVEVIVQIEDLSVHRDVATPLGLILNEVLSNAFKHAFPEGRSGRVTVTLAQGEVGTGVLSIRDNGVGYDPAVKSNGIGRRLITALVRQIGGEVTESGENGGAFEMKFPLAGAHDGDAG